MVVGKWRKRRGIGKRKGKGEKGEWLSRGGVGKNSASGVCFALRKNTFSTYMKVMMPDENFDLNWVKETMIERLLPNHYVDSNIYEAFPGYQALC